MKTDKQLSGLTLQMTQRSLWRSKARGAINIARPCNMGTGSSSCNDCRIELERGTSISNKCASSNETFTVRNYCCNCSMERGWNQKDKNFNRDNYDKKACRQCQKRAAAMAEAAYMAEVRRVYFEDLDIPGLM